MKRFEVQKLTTEIKNVNDVHPGCALDSHNLNPLTIKVFDTIEGAKKELENYSADVEEVESFQGETIYSVTEYVIEIYEADEDGEFVSGSDYEIQDWKYEE